MEMPIEREIVGDRDDTRLDEPSKTNEYPNTFHSLLEAARFVNPDALEITSVLSDTEMQRPYAPARHTSSRTSFNRPMVDGDDSDYSLAKARWL
ncbi:hypothetical protein AAF712_012512 [Marasmius tenuissimus]|uniref:Uncharacterized protein n=1 Tax=Marasmius tenuissimus TaxID=585030 RepID=A0ABR2ZIB3_9AGAR